MGNLGSLLWGFIWNTEDAIKDGEQSIIDGDENLTYLANEIRPTWARAKDLKNEWQEIEERQR